ncbi:MAG: C69 family dipeptidase [Sarcina sp.]
MCTTILIGKKASIDGSVIIGRNVDTFSVDTPMRFYVRKHKDNQSEYLKGILNDFKIKLPKVAYRCQLAPQVNIEKLGRFSECGFNEKNVGMSATESFYANKRVLACDRLVENGISEDFITDLILPYINSARGGVEYLGTLVGIYGSRDGNGVIFSDKNEIWYMELLTGHHWVAMKIPDDACCVISNQISIEEVDFDDRENFMYSRGIREFVEENNLNPNLKGWNSRKIFGTDSEKDRHYNTPRVWFAHKYLNKSVEESPVSSDLPFVFYADRKLSVEDAQYILRSHYDETKYDPYSSKNDDEKMLFRPIGVNRTQNSHIMQIRNSVREEISALMWLSLGGHVFSPYVVFYGNSNDTDISFRNTELKWDINDAFWMYRTLAALVSNNYRKMIEKNIDYREICNFEQFRIIKSIDEESKEVSDEDLSNYLTKKNYEITKMIKQETMKYIGELVTQSLELSKLTFNMDANL